MIKIIRENVTKELSDKEIEKLYEEIFIKCEKTINFHIDSLIEKLNNVKENAVKTYIRHELGSWNFDKNDNLEIPNAEEYIEDRNDLIDALNRVSNASDEDIIDDIDYILESIIDD